MYSQSRNVAALYALRLTSYAMVSLLALVACGDDEAAVHDASAGAGRDGSAGGGASDGSISMGDASSHGGVGGGAGSNHLGECQEPLVSDADDACLTCVAPALLCDTSCWGVSFSISRLA